MSDEWLVDGLPIAGDWSDAAPCAAPGGANSIVDNVTIKGSPGAVTSVANGNSLWSLVLNDGTPQADFRIDRFDDTGALASSPMTIARATGVVSFHDPVMLAADPVEPLEAATKDYVDSEIAAIGGIPEAPDTGFTYGREGDTATWNTVPTEAPVDGQLYARILRAWAPIQPISDAPNDGAAYVRQSLGWAPLSASLSGYMPLSGGVFTGVVQFPANNSVAIVGAAGTQRAILGGTAGPPTAFRWQMMLGDQTAETGGNAGSNFALNAISDTGAILSTPLAIARSTGVITVGVTPGVTALALNGAQGSWRSVSGQTNGSARWQMYLGDFGAELGGNLGSNFRLSSYADDGSALASPLIINRQTGQATFSALPSFPGGALNYVLATNGAGVLAWAAPQGGAPPSTTTPLPDGVGAVGTSTNYARADHVHPVSAYAHDNRIINGDMRIDQRNNGASGTATGIYTVDRWFFSASQTGRGTWGRNLNSVVSPGEFPYYLGFQSSSAYTLVAADTFQFRTALEGDAISDFVWGTPQAQAVTLSFWAYSSLTGTFSGSIRNYAATRSYPFTFSLPTANTWAKIVITVPGDQSGAWVLATNNGALYLTFDLGSGATFRGPAGAWAAGNYAGATGAVSVVATNGAFLALTGVKLEIGSIATPFNRQSLAKSLADCQRYYVNTNGVVISTAGYTNAAGQFVAQHWEAPVTMRAAPTIIANWSGGVNANPSAISALTDNRSVQSAITSAVAGPLSASLTITSLSAEL